jgi:hypothetical protein
MSARMYVRAAVLMMAAAAVSTIHLPLKPDSESPVETAYRRLIPYFEAWVVYDGQTSSGPVLRICEGSSRTRLDAIPGHTKGMEDLAFAVLDRLDSDDLAKFVPYVGRSDFPVGLFSKEPIQGMVFARFVETRNQLRAQYPEYFVGGK